ncbi:rod shape-determining protein RodA [Thermus thermophilus]|nr:rod shape-determining protein RodA [Thermus thermophilus]
MALGVMPVTGLTLPLFSYGGSSLIATLAGFGLALLVHRDRYRD